MEKSGGSWLKRMPDDLKDIRIHGKVSFDESKDGRILPIKHLKVIECLQNNNLTLALKVTMAEHINSVRKELITLLSNQQD